MTKQNLKSKAAKLTKRQKTWSEKVNSETTYGLEEAIKLLKACAKAKFDESVDVSINLGLDTKLADQQLRGVVPMPNGNGKKVRVAVFAKGDAAAAAEKAGAEVVGADDLVAKVKKGFLDFDRVVATPDCMPLVGQLGQILGPKGLMPNPKVGTVSANPAKVVQDIKAGLTEYRAEKNGIVHAQIAKVSFSDAHLAENITAFVTAIKAAKPASVKGIYMRKVTISSTMGPGIHVDFSVMS